MKRLAILLVATMLLAAPVTPNYDLTRIDAFSHHYAPFIRAYYGCPDKGMIQLSDCRPGAATFDVHALHQARDEAKRLFDLR